MKGKILNTYSTILRWHERMIIFGLPLCASVEPLLLVAADVILYHTATHTLYKRTFSQPSNFTVTRTYRVYSYKLCTQGGVEKMNGPWTKPFLPHIAFTNNIKGSLNNYLQILLSCDFF